MIKAISLGVDGKKIIFNGPEKPMKILPKPSKMIH